MMDLKTAAQQALRALESGLVGPIDAEVDALDRALAGALILAEIERLDRAAAAPKTGEGTGHV